MARRTVEDFNGFVSARPSKKSVPVVKPKPNDKKSIPAPALKTTTTNATKPSANIRKNSYNVRPPSKVENPKRTLGQKKILSDVKNKQEEVKSSQNEIKIDRKKDEVIETTTDGRTEGSTSDVSECQEYEDDFEDYESDFESDTSISLSPPTLPPTTNTVDQKISGDVSKKFSLPICVEEKLDVFLEEKFEVNSLERTIEMGLNNFKTAGKRKREQEAKNKIYTRGKMLMEMIKLDTVSYTLLDMPAIPYEQYIKMYGRSNMTQVQTQTHDDNAEKEVQTNEIDLTEKWTQHPIVLTNGLDCSSSEYQKEKSGVGGTGLDDRFNRSSRITTVDPVRVCDVGRLMLLLLEQQAMDRAEKQLLPNKFDLKFSNGYLSPDVSAVKFLAKRPVMSVQFARIEAFAPSLVTMHEVMDSCCQYAMCIWNVSNMKNPEYVLKCPNAVTCFCAIPKSSGGFVAAAHTDGSICLWDLGENRLHHQHIDHLQSPLRSPSFNSGLSIDQCHKSKIIGLSPVTYRNASFTNEELPNELCSVDEDFLLTVWAVVSSWTDACEISEHKCTGTAPWSSVRLVKLQTVEACKNIPKYMSDGVTATCMCLNTNQEAFVATNSGLVFRYNLGQQKVWPAYYTYENTGEHFSINWLEICPFDSNYFLASCSDGRMMLYSTSRREALSQFFASQDASKASSIVKAQWCTGFPGVVFALDSLSRVYVWDFCDDVTTPIMSITFQRENVTSMSLMSVQENHNTYMGLAFANGAVEMHQVKLSKRKKAESNDDKDYCDQLARFLASV